MDVHLFVGYFDLHAWFPSALLTSESPGPRRRKAVTPLVRSTTTVEPEPLRDEVLI